MCSVVNLSVATILKKSDSHQLSAATVSLPEVELHIHFPLPWYFFLLEGVPGCVCCHNYRQFVCVAGCFVWNILVPSVRSLPLGFAVFMPLCHGPLALGREGAV